MNCQMLVIKSSKQDLIGITNLPNPSPNQEYEIDIVKDTETVNSSLKPAS
jgi:hypothetical protein